MIMLVSLEQASAHLRRDTDDDDADLTLKIQAASQAVINYVDDLNFLDSSGEPEYDSSGDIVGVPQPLQAATLLILGDLYSDRELGEAEKAPRLGEITLSRTVHFLLDPYRIPTLR